MKKHCKKSNAALVLFVGYCALMLYLLFIRNRTGQSDLPYWQQVMDNYNLNPLRTISNYWDVLSRPEYYMTKWGSAAVYEQQARFAVVNLVGNVLMFIPLGFFLPLLWKKMQRIWKTFLLTGMLIVLVEMTQLLTLRGSCDVDDLILNLSGVIVGYVLWRLLLLCSRVIR